VGNVSFSPYKAAGLDGIFPALMHINADSTYLNHQQTKEILRIPRKTLRLIVGVYTGHNCLNRHLSVLRLINSPKCGNCNEADETALHYLCYCSHYGAVRTRSWGKPFMHPNEV